MKKAVQIRGSMWGVEASMGHMCFINLNNMIFV